MVSKCLPPELLYEIVPFVLAKMPSQIRSRPVGCFTNFYCHVSSNGKRFCPHPIKMVYGFINKVIKVLMFVTNFAIFCLGVRLFSFASLPNFSTKFPDFDSEPRFVDELDKILIGFASILLLVTVVGFFGAACESCALLTIYCVLMLILAMFEFGTVLALYTNRAELVDQQQCLAEDCFSVLKYKMDSNAALVRALLHLLVAQFFAMVFSCILCRAIRRTAGIVLVNAADWEGDDTPAEQGPTRFNPLVNLR
ncbi:hypothetical protein niasHT_016190 [Heterodera trifolii]|uniref:Tetraspanin n=1 Tax=Heterodera trifolii TaxID=157864 RepID=A0ABD2KTT4_9BILA